MTDSVGGAAQSGNVVPKGRRFAEAVIDLFIIPILLGVAVGLILVAINAGEVLRSVILVLVNIAWVIFRDAVYSPGRAMVGVKLTSLAGSKVTVTQAFIRNILIIIPFVLVIGYIVEIVSIIATGQRVGDKWAKTQAVLASA